MSHWAAAPLDRQQITLFAPTLDDSLSADHSVRLFDELLAGIDFCDWESMYIQVVGQPPIHPRVMAGCLLYGMSLGIRSSRKLEEACCNRLDFIWLMSGRKPDHSTFCGFRTQFGPQLKALFGKIGRLAIEMGLVSLNQVALDGTDIRANNSRYNTNRRASLEQKVAALDRQIEQAMAEAQQQDELEDCLYGLESSPAKLPKELRNLKARQERLKAAMAKLQQMEKQREVRNDLSPKGPAVPLADPDSRVLPNKSGGHAPNYTAVLATDSDSGIIVDVQVIGGNDEASTVLPAVANIQQSLGRKPQQLTADSNFNSGANLAGLEKQGVEPLMPARQEFAENPAVRPDPTRPVPPEQWTALPVNPQNKILDKAAFLYDQAKDCYHCPMGRVLGFVELKAHNHRGTKGIYRMYQCGECTGCPLAPRCLPKNALSRRVCRDEYEKHRQEMARRLHSAPGQKQYLRRAHAAETPFAVLKSIMGLRQFLLRGGKKVGLELLWAVTACNIVRILRFKAAATLCPAPTLSG